MESCIIYFSSKQLYDYGRSGGTTETTLVVVLLKTNEFDVLCCYYVCISVLIT